MKADVHPFARLVFLILATAGSFTVKSWWVSLTLWLLCAAALLLFGQGKKHLRLAVLSLLPLLIMLLVVWGWLIAAPPSMPIGSNPQGGIAYALSVFSRLGLLAAIFQLVMLTIPTQQLPNCLYMWGVRGESLIIALGAFTLVPELQIRADQVMTARLARGSVKGNQLISRAAQLPLLLQPLLTWTLRSAVQRSKSWNQSGLLRRIDELSKKGQKHASWQSYIWSIFGTTILGFSILDRLCR